MLEDPIKFAYGAGAHAESCVAANMCGACNIDVKPGVNAAFGEGYPSEEAPAKSEPNGSQREPKRSRARSRQKFVLLGVCAKSEPSGS